MGLERELKFRLSSDAAHALDGHALLRLAGPPSLRRLRTVYFDTEGLELGAAGLVLRLRDDGVARVLTVKARGDDALGAVRSEWEWAALDSVGEALGPRDLDYALRNTDLGRALPGSSPGAWHSRLRARFQTRFERRAWDIDWQGARIELALDQGACVALRDGQERSAPLCELELEVLHGELARAWDLAWTLGQDLALLLSPVDKARRAVALLRDERLPVPGEPIPLAREATMQQALRSWLQTACAQLAVWAERIAEADDLRDVHQFRVVLRRLRTALRWLADELPRGAARWLRGELRWAHQLAGLVRDADVSLQLLAEVDARAADEASALALRIAETRLPQRQALQAYVGSARFARLLMALARCAEIPFDAPRAGALRRMAAQALRRDESDWRGALDVDRVLRGAAAGTLPEPEQAVRVHRLRIASKRLRLSAERLAGLLPRKPRQHYAQAGKLATALQTHLGAWHDADRLSQALARESLPGTALRPWLQARALDALGEAWRTLEAAGAPRTRSRPPAGLAELAPPVPGQGAAQKLEGEAGQEPGQEVGPEAAQALLEPPRAQAQSVEAVEAVESVEGQAGGAMPWADQLVPEEGEAPSGQASLQALPGVGVDVDASSSAIRSAR